MGGCVLPSDQHSDPLPRFRFIPFLLELRAVIGWMWTDTALSLSNWICLEDIYANIFIMKCWQESEKVSTRWY